MCVCARIQSIIGFHNCILFDYHAHRTESGCIRRLVSIDCMKTSDKMFIYYIMFDLYLLLVLSGGDL